MELKGEISFNGVKNTESIKSLSFQFSNFGKSLILPDVTFNCVVDLTNTKITNQLTLHGLVCHLQTHFGYWGLGLYEYAVDRDDAARFRRLKEIAADNKDHVRALDFNANENRAKRWGEYGKLASLLDIMYCAISDYGRSILRPSIALLITIFLFTCIHLINSDGYQLANALELTLINSLPFIKIAGATSLKDLYNNEIPNWAPLATFAQGFFSLICAFFIGLGLRNRFRI